MVRGAEARRDVQPAATTLRVNKVKPGISRAGMERRAEILGRPRDTAEADSRKSYQCTRAYYECEFPCQFGRNNSTRKHPRRSGHQAIQL